MVTSDLDPFSSGHKIRRYSFVRIPWGFSVTSFCWEILTCLLFKVSFEPHGYISHGQLFHIGMFNFLKELLTCWVMGLNLQFLKIVHGYLFTRITCFSLSEYSNTWFMKAYILQFLKTKQGVLFMDGLSKFLREFDIWFIYVQADSSLTLYRNIFTWTAH